MKKIRTNTDEISIDEHGIIHKKVTEGAHIDIAELQESEEICQGLSKQDKFLIMVDATAVHTMTPEAVKLLKEHIDTKRIAAAIISNRLGMRIMIDYFINVEKSTTPIKIFHSHEEALAWLLQFKKN
jgi:hypothetical protein